MPGVQTDRLNVAGSQSGQQSAFIGMGTDSSQNSFNMDGVTITDMAALGASPTYYDFDQFQEVQVATGGTDPAIAVPGVTLNMVTKRGTNEPHGSARYFYSPGELQAHNAPEEAKQQADLGLFGAVLRPYAGCRFDRVIAPAVGARLVSPAREADQFDLAHSMSAAKVYANRSLTKLKRASSAPASGCASAYKYAAALARMSMSSRAQPIMALHK